MENKKIFLNIYGELKILFDKAIKEKIFPGAAVGISVFGTSKKQSFLCTFGAADYEGSELNKDFFYDLASLTKPLATTLALLSLLKNKISLEDTLPDLLEIKIKNDKKNIKLKHLLGHCAGFPAYRPYFKKAVRPRSYALVVGQANKEKIINKILTEKLCYKIGEKQLYSDLGFMLLGYIIEKKSSLRLDEYVSQQIYKPINLDRDLFFNFENKEKNRLYAPTELCPWRKKLLCGQVHDDNAFMMNGVAGQAGLFGNIYGVNSLINYLVDIIAGKQNHPNINRNDLLKLIKKQENKESFGLGFDTPSSQNSSSGKYFSNKSFGHLGFTGTSFWVDLTNKISIVLLTNRVHPHRENNKIRKFRPEFHNKVMEIMLKKREKNEK